MTAAGLETDGELSGEAQSFNVGFSLGEIRTNSTLRMKDVGEWTEITEISTGSQRPENTGESW